MTTTWLPGATIRDLSGFVTNGSFTSFLGVCLHVNSAENGTPIDFWGPGNGESVTPNFQVMKDGTVDQMLPFGQQPWCQVLGNFNYAAIETAGLNTEPLTDAQCASIAKILHVYITEYGMKPQVVDVPGQPGLITHGAGGVAWGDHPYCPGDIRAGQRKHLLDLATAHPTTTSEDDVARIMHAKDTGKTYLVSIANGAQLLNGSAEITRTEGLLQALHLDATIYETDESHVETFRGVLSRASAL